MTQKITKKIYKPKLKIGDYILDINRKELGKIERIDNHCNMRDNNSTIDEYYVLWPSCTWTRYDSKEFDSGMDREIYGIIPATPAAVILYGPKTKKRLPAQIGRRS